MSRGVRGAVHRTRTYVIRLTNIASSVEYMAVVAANTRVGTRRCSPLSLAFWDKMNEHPSGHPTNQSRPRRCTPATSSISNHAPTQTKTKQVNIKGDAMFDDLRAEAGGAIYNGEGAEFRFKKGATAVFIDCLSFDGTGGSVYNRCDFLSPSPRSPHAAFPPCWFGTSFFSCLASSLTLSGSTRVEKSVRDLCVPKKALGCSGLLPK